MHDRPMRRPIRMVDPVSINDVGAIGDVPWDRWARDMGTQSVRDVLVFAELVVDVLYVGVR